MPSNHPNLEENPITEFYNTVIKRQRPVDRELRFLNYLIDFTACFLLARGAGYFLSYMGFITIETGKITLYLISFFSYFMYFFLAEWTAGRTLGKLVTGTKVMSENGDVPSVLQIISRTLCRIIPFEGLSFLVSSEGWHDTMSGTVVTKTRNSK